MIPASNDKETCSVNPTSSIISGNKCINAPPSNAPVEKLTKNKINFLSFFAFKEKVNKPAKANKLTIRTLASEYTITDMFDK